MVIILLIIILYFVLKTSEIKAQSEYARLLMLEKDLQDRNSKSGTKENK